VKRLRGSDMAAALDFPGPDNQRVKMVTYAVNWAVEFAIVAVLVFFFVRPFWRDLMAVRRAAEEVGAGHFEARASVGRHSALRDLAGLEARYMALVARSWRQGGVSPATRRKLEAEIPNAFKRATDRVQRSGVLELP